MENNPDYSGMTTNERLFAAGLIDAWDRAAKRRNRNAMIDILRKVTSDEEAASITDAVLSNPRLYGF